jgi:nucleoside-diphosphate-sugar epimerase
MKIGILGSSSALGEALAKDLFEKNVDALSIGRNHSDYCQNTKFFDLNEPSQADKIFDENLDVLVLISWIQKPRNKIAMERNFVAYSKIIESAHKNNVKVIFISTLGTIGDVNQYMFITRN